MRALCVYCGSNPGNTPRFGSAAAALGRMLAERHITLVYGGGNVGLMGIVADAALAAGGEVHGVIPRSLVEKEVAHTALTRLDVVDSMHARKARMFELSDGFVALPGGLGTLDEIFEMLTWRQLGLGQRPCAFLDVGGFWRPLMGALDHMVEHGFLKAAQREDLWYGDDPGAMLGWMSAYVPPRIAKWVQRPAAAGEIA